MPEATFIGDQASTPWLALRARAMPALREIPGAIALHEFGAAAAGRVDAWSDIDLQLAAVAVDDAVRGRVKPLLEIGPVWLEWTIVDSPTSWAATVLFEGMSPLCHLDLGIVAGRSGENNAFLDDAILHWRQAGVARDASPAPDWFTPATGTVEHLVLGELLGLVRYAKSRHRGHSLLCWKFFSAIAHRVLEAEYLARVDPGRGFRKPLTSHEHARLREAMPADEMDALAEMLSCDRADTMDAAIVALGQRLVDRAGTTGQVFRDRCDGLLGWLARELDVQRGR